MEPQIETSSKPNLTDLRRDFQDAGGLWCSALRGTWARNIQLTRWPGQTLDGKKHRKAIGSDPHPYEGASDARVPLVDGIITELVDLVMTAAERSEVAVNAVGGEDIPRATNARKVLVKYRDQIEDFDDELDFAAELGFANGVTVVQILWELESGLEEFELTFGQLSQFAEISGDPRAIQLLTAIETGNRSVAADLLRQFLEPMVQQMRSERYDSRAFDGWSFSKAKATEAAADLIAGKRTTVSYPCIAKSGPAIVTRQLGYDILINGGLHDVQRARAVHIIEWLSEVELRGRIATHGYNEAWVDEAVKTAGTRSVWTDTDEEEYTQSDGRLIASFTPSTDAKDKEIEVITTYAKRIDTDGVVVIEQTAWSAHINQSTASKQDIYALHEPLNYRHGRYPIEAYRREIKSRPLANSRGVTDMAATWQGVQKDMIDALRDRTDKELNPPLKVKKRYGMQYGVGPSSQLPMREMGDTSYMDPPKGSPALALELYRVVQELASWMFGLVHPQIPTTTWQLRQTRVIKRWLRFVARVYRQMFALIQQFATERDLIRIAGTDQLFPRSTEEIRGQFDWTLKSDPRDFDTEYLWKKLDAITRLVVPLDSNNRINKGTLVELITMAIDPTYRDILIQEPAQAEQQLYDQTLEAVMQMYQGNEPPMVMDADPSAPARYNMLKDIISKNPKYQRALGLNEKLEPVGQADNGSTDHDFQERVSVYEQNLSQAMAQASNRATGRFGVKTQTGRVAAQL